MPESNGAYFMAVIYINTQFATEAHGKTRKNKCITRNISVSFRVFPWRRA